MGNALTNMSGRFVFYEGIKYSKSLYAKDYSRSTAKGTNLLLKNHFIEK